MWSDECSTERGKGKEQEWCFGQPANKWKPDFVTTYTKGKDISIMAGYASGTKTGQSSVRISIF